jgi:hypothetical protein
VPIEYRVRTDRQPSSSRACELRYDQAPGLALTAPACCARDRAAVDSPHEDGQYPDMGTGDSREGELMKRWRQGQVAAARRKLELCAEEGPDAQQAVAEALSAFDLLSRTTAHPSERDPVSEREVMEVRRRWARIQKRARKKR